jgi:hypothetical protein
VRAEATPGTEASEMKSPFLSTTLLASAAAIATVAGTLGTAGAFAQDGGLTTSITVRDPAASGDRSFGDVHELLDAVDAADRGITTLRAGVRYIVEQALAGDTQTRDGTFHVRLDWPTDGSRGAPDLRFAIDFARLIVDGRVSDEVKRYAFDGEWLLELIPGEKQFTRVQIVPPGERADPFERLGSAPFLALVGQDREKLLRDFDAEIRPATEWFRDGDGNAEAMPASLAARASELIQMRLIPKAGSPVAEDWVEVGIWYDRATLLPVISAAEEPVGDRQIVLLYDTTVNGALDEAVFTTTPPSGPGWQGSVRPYREAVAPGTGG